MTQKETNEEILKSLYEKLNKVLPETIYISAENAKYVELIPSNEILFISTEKADTEDIKVLLEENYKSKGSSNERIVIYTVQGKKFYNKDSIKEIEKKLSKDSNFLRTHISYIVNLRQARGIQSVPSRGYILIMKNIEKQVPVSQTYQKAVKDYFGI